MFTSKGNLSRCERSDVRIDINHLGVVGDHDMGLSVSYLRVETVV